MTSIQRRPPSQLDRPSPPVIEATVTHEYRVVHEVHVAHDDYYRDRAWLRAAIALWVVHALLLAVAAWVVWVVG